MKAWIARGLTKQKVFVTLFFSFLIIFGFSYKTRAQGWGFTINLTQTGPCGSGLPSLPTFIIPSVFPSRGQCEALRQTILAVKETFPVYDGSKYIGDCSLFYTCTPCSGSDLVSPGQVNPGEVAFDGQFSGRPLFTPHESSAFDDWAKDYKQQLEAFGIKSIIDNTLTSMKIPSTGDKDFDAFYSNQTNNFNPTTSPVKPPALDASVVDLSESKGVVGLLTTPEEQAKRDKWYKDQGFNDLSPISNNTGVDEGMAAQMSLEEKGLRFTLENLPVVGTVAGGLLNIVDVVLGEDGLPKAFGQATKGDYQGALETSGNMTNGVTTAVANTMKKTIVNSFTDPIKGLFNSKIISAFGVGEKGAKAVEVVVGAVELSQEWKPNK